MVRVPVPRGGSCSRARVASGITLGRGAGSVSARGASGASARARGGAARGAGADAACSRRQGGPCLRLEDGGLGSKRLAMWRVLAMVAPGHRSRTAQLTTGTPPPRSPIARRESHSDVRHCLVIQRSSSGFIDLLSVKSHRDSYAE
jgi:hypothetical protein